jgi:hypothetical protein
VLEGLKPPGVDSLEHPFTGDTKGFGCLLGRNVAIHNRIKSREKHLVRRATVYTTATCF